MRAISFINTCTRHKPLNQYGKYGTKSTIMCNSEKKNYSEMRIIRLTKKKREVLKSSLCVAWTMLLDFSLSHFI